MRPLTGYRRKHWGLGEHAPASGLGHKWRTHTLPPGEAEGSPRNHTSPRGPPIPAVREAVQSHGSEGQETAGEVPKLAQGPLASSMVRGCPTKRPDGESYIAIMHIHYVLFKHLY